jgi:hypothetical protein
MDKFCVACDLPHEALENLAFHARMQEKVIQWNFASAVGIHSLKGQAQILHFRMRALFAL